MMRFVPLYQLPPWFQERDNLLLLLALLLCMWWLLIRRRYEEEKRRPSRPMPLSEDELGRFIFQALRNSNFFLWRDLFLNGGEARDLLGEHGEAYLEARSREVLSESLSRLAGMLPNGAIYSGVEIEDERLFLLAQPSKGEPKRLEIGTITRVERLWRLFGPAQ